MEKYELIGRAGAGAFSTVYKCRNTEGELVAVKRLDAPSSEQVLASLLQEACILRHCTHKNIVQLHGVYQGANSGAVFLACEYVDKTLSRELLLNPRGLPLPRAKVIMWQLVHAVSHLHHKGVMHRDLKPANVLLTAGYTIKLCDFGSAACTHTRSTADKNVAGAPGDVTHMATRWYCAPESLLGLSQEAPADIWALGCIFAELVTGRPLLPGEDAIDQLACVLACVGSLGAQHEALLQLLPQEQLDKLNVARARGPLLEGNAKLSSNPQLLELLRACLQPDPMQRPTATQLAGFAVFDDLRQALAAGGSSSGSDNSGEQMPVSRPASSAGTPTSPLPAPPTSHPSNGAVSAAAPRPVALLHRSQSSNLTANTAVQPYGVGLATRASISGAISQALARAAPTANGAPGLARIAGAVPARVAPARGPVSALTATIKGSRAFDGDESFIDLMPRIQQTLQAWQAKAEALGPIALAARHGCHAGPKHLSPVPSATASSSPQPSQPLQAAPPALQRSRLTQSSQPLCQAPSWPLELHGQRLPPFEMLPARSFSIAGGAGQQSSSAPPSPPHAAAEDMSVSAAPGSPMALDHPAGAEQQLPAGASTCTLPDAAAIHSCFAPTAGQQQPSAAGSGAAIRVAEVTTRLPNSASAGNLSDLSLLTRTSGMRRSYSGIRAARMGRRQTTDQLVWQAGSCPKAVQCLAATTAQDDGCGSTALQSAAAERRARLRSSGGSLMHSKVAGRRSYSDGLAALHGADGAGVLLVGSLGAESTGSASKRRRAQVSGTSVGAWGCPATTLAAVGTWLTAMQQCSVPEHEPLLTAELEDASALAAAAAGRSWSAGAWGSLQTDGGQLASCSFASHAVSLPRPIRPRDMQPQHTREFGSGSATQLGRSLVSDVYSLASDVGHCRLATASCSTAFLD